MFIVKDKGKYVYVMINGTVYEQEAIQIANMIKLEVYKYKEQEAICFVDLRKMKPFPEESLKILDELLVFDNPKIKKSIFLTDKKENSILNEQLQKTLANANNYNRELVHDPQTADQILKKVGVQIDQSLID